MDIPDFDSPQVDSDRLMSDAVDALDTFAEEYENAVPPPSGLSTGSTIAFILGFMALAAGFLLSSPWCYLTTMAAILVGYHFWADKNKEKTAYRYKQAVRTAGIVLALLALVLTGLFYFNVIVK